MPCKKVCLWGALNEVQGCLQKYAFVSCEEQILQDFSRLFTTFTNFSKDLLGICTICGIFLLLQDFYNFLMTFRILQKIFCNFQDLLRV